jgi:hypothetical protein
MAKQLEFSIKILGTDTQVKKLDAMKASLASFATAMEGVAKDSIAFDVLDVKAGQVQKAIGILEAEIATLYSSANTNAAAMEAASGKVIAGVGNVGDAIAAQLDAVFAGTERLEGSAANAGAAIGGVRDAIESIQDARAADGWNESFEQVTLRVSRLREEVEQAGSTFENLAAPFGNMLAAMQQAEMAYYDDRTKEYNNRIDELEKKAKDATGRQGAIYEAQLKAERRQMEQNEAAKEQARLKYARLQKARDISEATIVAVKSAAGAFSAMVGIPVVGPVLAPIAAAAAAAFGAAQVAAIAATPLALGGELSGDIAQVRHGHIPAGAGEISGASHSDASGGVHFTYRGKPFAAEGGELKTNNGGKRYIFTKGVGRDPLLRRLALATHNSSGSFVAHMVAGIVNAAGGGRSFSQPMAGAMLAAGGDLSFYTQPLLPQPIQVQQAGTDTRIIALLEETKATQALLNANLNELQKRQDNLRIVLPVDQLNELQQNETFVKVNAIF